MAALMPQGKQQYFTAGGIPLVGGKVYTYAAGTTTPLATYTTAAASTPNANPVILDSRGEASIFFSAANYKIVVKDSLDSTIWTQDNLAGDAAATIVANLAASTGSSLVGHIASGTGAVATTVQAVLRETVSIMRFIPIGTNTLTTTCTAYVQAAINYCAANGWPDLEVSQVIYLATSVNIDRPVNTSVDEFKIVGRGANAGFYTDQPIKMFDTTLVYTTDPQSERIVFEGIRFAASANTLDCKALAGGGFLRMRFLDCVFYKCRAAVSATYLQSWYFSDCSFLTLRSYAIEANTAAYNVIWNDCLFEDGSSGVAATGFLNCSTAVGCSFQGGVFQGSYGPFYRAIQTTSASFSGIYFELNTDMEIKLGICTAASITGCLFDNPIASGDKYCVDCTGVLNLHTGGNTATNKLFYNPPTSLGVLDEGVVSTGDYAANVLFGNGAETWANTGSFTATLSGFTTTVTLTVDYQKLGRMVMLSWADTYATSNTNTMYMTGIPQALIPHGRIVNSAAPIQDNTVLVGMTTAQITSGGIQFCKSFAGPTGPALTAAGTKGITAFTLSYRI